MKIDKQMIEKKKQQYFQLSYLENSIKLRNNIQTDLQLGSYVLNINT